MFYALESLKDEYTAVKTICLIHAINLVNDASPTTIYHNLTFAEDSTLCDIEVCMKNCSRYTTTLPYRSFIPFFN